MLAIIICLNYNSYNKMERVPQLKDIVIISHPEQESSSYIISEITPNMILLINPIDSNITGALIIKDDHWKVAGTDIDYQIEIMEPILLTHVRNVDMNVLLQLDDKSLHSACQLNKYTQSLCNDNIFWHLKI